MANAIDGAGEGSMRPIGFCLPSISMGSPTNPSGFLEMNFYVIGVIMRRSGGPNARTTPRSHTSSHSAQATHCNQRRLTAVEGQLCPCPIALGLTVGRGTASCFFWPLIRAKISGRHERCHVECPGQGIETRDVVCTMSDAMGGLVGQTNF